MLKLMNFFSFLLAPDFSGAPDGIKEIMVKIYEVIESIVVPVIILVATVGIIYAIVLGVNYAKAETSDAKEEAKKRIINVVVGAVLIIVLVLLMYLFISNADAIFGWAAQEGGIA
ncbi:MAG: hypothetical protein IJA61_01635 [Clostridia bacterium]|nr:hypothetical protein [Clostridia bacterium]